MEEQVEWKARSAPQTKTNKNLSTLSKSTCGAPGAYEGLTAAMVAELMIGFWFGIGAILAIKTVQSLEELISRK